MKLRFARLAWLPSSVVTIASLGCATDPPLAPVADAGSADTTVIIDAGDAGTREPGAPLSSMKHLVVIYLENHSFDNLFGSWPGAANLTEAAGSSGAKQVGPDGHPYTTLPEYGPYPATGVESLVDASVPNSGPFDLTKYYQEGAIVNDLLHRFYQEQSQINGGKMDSYVLYNDESAGQSMGYWPTFSLAVPMWMKGHSNVVTLCDHFFHAAFGGSFLNHQWLIAARSPVYASAPTGDGGVVATLNDAGRLVGPLDTTSVPPSMVYNTATDDGEVTPDGFVVNTAYSVNEPHPSKFDTPTAAINQLVPQQTNPTIGDALDKAGVGWAWYAGGWNTALAAAGISSVGTDAGSQELPDGSATTFQYHHQPFTYYQNWGGNANGGGVGTVPPNGKWAKNRNLKDELDFLAEAKAGTLPPVSFVKPLYDEHSNYTTETDSETHTVSLLQAITSSPSWSDTVVIITYDENGGFWDHHGGARRRSGCAIPCANVSAYVSRAARAISRGWRSPHSRFAENFVG